jgi:WhiB family redox-sensing transcriptional regulator
VLTPTSAIPALTLRSVPRDTTLPCWTADPDLWFAESPSCVEEAKTLCLPCPLREPCLAGALERREPWGVWGGQLVLAGVVVPRKRPRGRPPKAAEASASPAPAAAAAASAAARARRSSAA